MLEKSDSIPDGRNAAPLAVKNLDEMAPVCKRMVGGEVISDRTLAVKLEMEDENGSTDWRKAAWMQILVIFSWHK